MQTCTTEGSGWRCCKKGLLCKESKFDQVRAQEGLPMVTPRASAGDVLVTMSVGFVAVADVDQRARDEAVVDNVRYQIEMDQRDREIMKRVVGRVLE